MTYNVLSGMLSYYTTTTINRSTNNQRSRASWNSVQGQRQCSWTAVGVFRTHPKSVGQLKQKYGVFSADFTVTVYQVVSNFPLVFVDLW